MTSVLDLGALAVAGVGAGVINTVAGAGSLLSWPVMLALGLPPVHANVANTVGLLPGSLAGLHGYRRHLPADRCLLVGLALVAVLGAGAGGSLLLVTASRFSLVAAVCLLGVSALVWLQPHLDCLSSSRHPHSPGQPAPRSHDLHVHGGGDVLLVQSARADVAVRQAPAGGGRLYGASLAGSLYSGYFAGGLGLVLFGVLSAALPTASVQQINALKLWIGSVITIAAATVFLLAGMVTWPVAIALGIGSLIGGYLGAWIGPRLRPDIVRGSAAVLGLLCAVSLLL